MGMTNQTEEQFAAFYRDYSDKIYRFLFWRIGDQAIAEDLTSETFIRAWQHRNRFDGRYPAAWFYQIARRILIDFWRKKKPLPLQELPDSHPRLVYTQDLLGEISQREQLDQIRRQLNRLHEPLQSVIILRFFEEYSVKEVAQILKLSESNIRVIQYRALQALRTELNHKERP